VTKRVLFVLMLSVALVGCSKEQAPEPEPVVRPLKTIVIGGGGGAMRTYPGRVDASERVDLSFRVGGPLIELPIDKGQDVSARDVLARIDPRDYVIRIQEARAQFVKADADFTRFQTLYEREAASLADLELARSQRDVAQARLEDAHANHGDTYLRAPFDGVIADIYVDNFEKVQPNQPVLSLIDLRSIDIVVDLPEFAVARASRATTIKLTGSFDVAPGQVFPLTFKEIAAQADPRTQTYEVTLTMPQPEGVNILPGMTARVEAVITGLEDADDVPVTIPSIAVVPADAGGQFVWVVDESTMTVSRRDVEIGEVTGEREIYVLSGLAIGDRIAVAGVHQLREGMKVRLMTR
jgi:RND family efflux transporter MFP subunit